MDGYCPRCCQRRGFLENLLRNIGTLGFASVIDRWHDAKEGGEDPDACRECGQEYDWDDSAFEK